MKKKYKDVQEVTNGGITLVALVITIIVLLILAGITINLTFGNNGLLNRAKQGAEVYKLGEINDINSMDKVTEYMNKYFDGKTNDKDDYDDFINSEEYKQILETIARLKEESEQLKKDNESIQIELEDVKKANEQLTKENATKQTEIANLQEEYDKKDEDYKKLLEEFNKLDNKQLTFINKDRTTCTIPKGITQAYVIWGDGTDNSKLNCNITGTIIKNSTLLLNDTKVDNYQRPLRETLEIYKLDLNGEEGEIKINAIGGEGTYRAWTAIVAYMQ